MIEAAKKQAKKRLRQMGIKRAHLNVLQYWVPYTFADGKAFAPNSITVELTFRCNLSCQMCPLDVPRVMYNRSNHEYVAARKKEEMTTAEVLALIDDIAAMGVKQITLTGGESFLRTDIFEILARVKARGLKCCVNTNGWFLGKAQARRLVEMGIDALSISVDGPNETHDLIRRREGSFKHILESLTNLEEAKAELGRSNPGVGITCTIFALNQRNFSEVLDWLKDYKVISSVEFEYMFFTERWAEEATEKLIPLPVAKKEEDQVLPFYLRDIDVDVFHAEVQRTQAKAKEYKMNVAFQPPLKTKDEIGKRFFDVTHAYVQTCFYPWKAARVNPYGDVYSCSIDVAFGNIRKKSFSRIWNGDAYRLFRRTLKQQGIFPKCTKCCALSDRLWDQLPRLRLR
ncbi:MAG TPA: radical SAM protein [Methylomirabilota bacterium]|jgi:MoaA/NifB/PqqE/SkfB family radical SAM enzyme|nr:radical SAM protein [Methylomirabilota bacterium]